MTLGNRYPAAVIAAGLLWSIGGCAGAGADANGADGVDRGKRDTALEHEPCDLTASGAVRDDADESGRPDIVRVMDGSREVCRAVDINRDSLIDVFVYFDDSGQERRREYGFDRDDRPDEIVILENGQVTRKLRETNNDRRIDTWDYYEGGRLVREERDSVGDGYIDQWWTFPDPQRPDCAIVVTDGNGDGKPDEDSRLDLCADKAGTVPAPGAAPSLAKGTGAATAADAGGAAAPKPTDQPATATPPTPNATDDDYDEPSGGAR